MNPLARTSVRLATLATLVVGLAAAPAAAAPEPESVRCNQAPRPAPVCSIEKAAPIYHARPVLAPPDGRPVGIIHRADQLVVTDAQRHGVRAASATPASRAYLMSTVAGDGADRPGRRGFDFGDAAIGLALGIGLALLVLAVRALRGRGPLAHL